MSSPATPNLDSLDRLPAKNRLSLVLLLVLTSLNAFNDNILKMQLIGLAPKVSEGSLGQDIGIWLGAIILLPFILLAPVAGYLSDRFSKRSVILAMLLSQSVILLTVGALFQMELGESGILVSLLLFFLLAVQSTLFSPAKMGILKDLAGSRRLGVVSGWLQLVTMVGLLGGLSLGGPWFDAGFQQSGNPWSAAAAPIWILFGVSLVAIFLGWRMQGVPAHDVSPFQVSVLWKHFSNLGESLSQYGLRRAMLGTSVYWLVGSMATAMFVDIGLQLHPDAESDGAASATSKMTFMVGIGTVLGSILVSAVSRKGLQLGIVPIGAMGMAAGLLMAGLFPADLTRFDLTLSFLGLTGACYLVPMQAYIQDRAEPSRRGRVLSSMNLLNSFAGVAAVALLFLLKKLGTDVSTQFWVLSGLMVVTAIYVVRLLPQDLIRFVGRGLIRSIYRVRGMHLDRVPKEGGLLLLPNHVSYVDALILSTACERPIRFVIWETIYKVRWFNGVLRLFGAVPISPTRAKDAVRSVVTALKDEEVVCLFPEGQITRHGMINELRKGFELMARQAKCPVQPVYLDGLWGSIFSFQGGKCFTKRPKKLRYPVNVNFGEPIPAKEASTQAIRSAFETLGSEAFLHREAFRRHREMPRLQLANALRLGEIEWHRPGDRLVGLNPAVCETLELYQRLHRDIELGSEEGAPLILIGTADQLKAVLKDETPAAQFHRLICLTSAADTVPRSELEALGVPLDLAWVEQDALLALEVPDPEMPKGQEGNQAGRRPGSLGRLLPGIRSRQQEGTLNLTGLAPDEDGPEIRGVGLKLDGEGFVVRVDSAPESPPDSPPQSTSKSS